MTDNRPKLKYLPYDKGHLGLKSSNASGILDYNSKVASTLIVQAKVLGERLGAEKFESSVNKVSDGPGISIQATRGKTYIEFY